LDAQGIKYFGAEKGEKKVLAEIFVAKLWCL